jgi:hypothetical protein
MRSVGFSSVLAPDMHTSEEGEGSHEGLKRFGTRSRNLAAQAEG